MADFSKEYVDKYMDGCPADFSIVEEAAKLKSGEWMPIICEGYGFFGIYKDDEGDTFLLFEEEERPTQYRLVRIDKLDEEENKWMYGEK